MSSQRPRKKHIPNILMLVISSSFIYIYIYIYYPEPPQLELQPTRCPMLTVDSMEYNEVT